MPKDVMLIVKYVVLWSDKIFEECRGYNVMILVWILYVILKWQDIRRCREYNVMILVWSLHVILWSDRIDCLILRTLMYKVW